MNLEDATWQAYERLVDALSADLLGADAAEVEGSHPRRGARVQADSLRQALRRGLASAPPDDGRLHELLRDLTVRPQREDKP